MSDDYGWDDDYCDHDFRTCSCESCSDLRARQARYEDKCCGRPTVLKNYPVRVVDLPNPPDTRETWMLYVHWYCQHRGHEGMASYLTSDPNDRPSRGPL